MTAAPDLLKIRAAVLERAEAFRAAEKPQEAPAEGAPRRAFRLLDLSEMLAEPRPTAWLLRDYLEAEALACLFGASGSMKSFVALDMGLSIASGLPWHGVDVPQPGPVVYVAGEGFRGLSRRIKAWLRAHHLTGEGLPFHVASEAVQLLDPASVEAATSAIAALAERPRLIVVDTLARCYGGDENSTEDMSAFIAALDRLRARFGCAVLVVHHSGLAERDRARGASALRAAVDWEYRLDVRDDTRVLTCTKAKDHDAPADMAFEADTVPTGWTDPETGDPIGSLVLRQVGVPGKKGRALTGAKRIALEALRAACEAEGRAHIEKWRAEAYRRGVSASEDQENKRRTFKRAVADLLDLGLVGTLDDHFWTTGQPDKTGQCPDMSGGHQTGRTGQGSLDPVRCPVSVQGQGRAE